MQLQRYKERRTGSFLSNKAVNITNSPKRQYIKSKRNRLRSKETTVIPGLHEETIWQTGGEPHGEKTEQDHSQEVS